MEDQAKQHQKWWQPLRKHRVAIGVGAIVFVVVIAFIIIGYRFEWTGFGPETSDPKQHAKTLFDWLNLIGVLAIPVVVGIGAALYTASQSKASEEKNRLQHAKDLIIIQNQQQEELLQRYLNQMSDLMLNGLRSKGKPDNVREDLRAIARGRTLTTLLSLDKDHKGNVLQFLLVSGLINKEDSIVDLSQANLRETNIHGAMLSGANLSKTFLNQADLSITYLSEADLSGANLSEADLTRANLSGADLSRADLSKAIFTEADLSNANLSNANLRNAWLQGAKLQGTNLSKTNLTNANLRGAEMINRTDLSEAILEGAKYNDELIHDESSKGVAYDIKRTVWPQGFEPKEQQYGLDCDNRKTSHIREPK